MEIYLGECLVYVIMMISRWSSIVFLLYIKKQVKQFRHNVLFRILHLQFHQHIPDRESRISRCHKRQCNHPNNDETRKIIIGRMA